MQEQQILLIILLLPLIASIVGWAIGRKSEKLRDVFYIVVTGAVFLLVILLYKYIHHGSITLAIPGIMGEGLYLELDGFRYIFVFITSLVWLLATMYSTQYLTRYKNRNRYYAFFIVTLFSTIGIFISQDLLNLFTFFEIMSFSSYLLVIHDEDKYAHDAGTTYIAVAIIGGLVLLMGLFLLYDYTDTLNINLLKDRIMEIGNVKYLIAILMIIGFGVKAGMMPLHVWLPKAHPAAPSPASAILSGILLKTGVFGIIITCIIMNFDIYISNAIIFFGFLTMFFGGILAMLQKHLKRILAYSSMSQIGYVLVGIGLMGILGDHKDIAISGTILHMVNHAMYKVLLFLGAGIIYMILHEMNINIILGFGRKKPLLKLVVFIGFMGLIGMPGFGGFISKNLLHEALIEAVHIQDSMWLKIGEFIFTLSSCFTVAYMLKAFITVFIEKNEEYSGQHKKHITKRALLPLVVLSIIVIILGFKPELVIDNIHGSLLNLSSHEQHQGSYYTAHNIINVLLPMIYGLLIYIFIIRGLFRIKLEDKKIYFNPIPDWFDLEQILYIPVGKFLYKIGLVIFLILDTAIISIIEWSGKAFDFIGDIDVNIDFDSFNRIDSKTILKNIIKIKKKPNKDTIDKTPKIKISNNVKPINNYKLANVLKEISLKFNSIMYSIFIFAGVLVAVLIFLMINKS